VSFINIQLIRCRFDPRKGRSAPAFDCWPVASSSENITGQWSNHCYCLFNVPLVVGTKKAGSLPAFLESMQYSPSLVYVIASTIINFKIL
jgi:hypothetical protein